MKNPKSILKTLRIFLELSAIPRIEFASKTVEPVYGEGIYRYLASIYHNLTVNSDKFPVPAEKIAEYFDQLAIFDNYECRGIVKQTLSEMLAIPVDIDENGDDILVYDKPRRIYKTGDELILRNAIRQAMITLLANIDHELIDECCLYAGSKEGSRDFYEYISSELNTVNTIIAELNVLDSEEAAPVGEIWARTTGSYFAALDECFDRVRMFLKENFGKEVQQTNFAEFDDYEEELKRIFLSEILNPEYQRRLLSVSNRCVAFHGNHTAIKGLLESIRAALINYYVGDVFYHSRFLDDALIPKLKKLAEE